MASEIFIALMVAIPAVITSLATLIAANRAVGIMSGSGRGSVSDVVGRIEGQVGLCVLRLDSLDRRMSDHENLHRL